MEAKEAYRTEVLGRKISKELAGYLKRHTKGTDRAQVSIDTDVSMTSINAVIGGSHYLTKFNLPAIQELIKVARENCSKNIEEQTQELENMELFIPLNVREDEKEGA